MAIDLGAGTVELTRALCDIESVSGGEGRIADELERALAGLAHLTVTRHGDAIVARTTLGRPTRVAIAGHIDTVPVNRNLPTRFEHIDGVEHLWGRGTVDMKAGVAVQLALAAELSDPVVDITWIWYDHEEVAAELNGLGRLARTHPELIEADFAILGEPTNGRVEGGCNGTIRIDVCTEGVRAHSARAWVGDNAIHKAAPVLDLLADYRPRIARVDGLTYREGLNATRISGGVAGNVIPDECTVHVNYRFAPDRSLDEALAELHELFGHWRVEVVDASPGARPGLDVPIARDFVAATGADAVAKQGWTDVARFSALGIPAVNYGPGDALKAHADDESVAVHQITDCETRLRAWLTGTARAD